MATATKRTATRATAKKAAATPTFSDTTDTDAVAATEKAPAAPRTARKPAAKATTKAAPAKPATGRRTTKKAAALTVVPDAVETPAPPAKRTAVKKTAKAALPAPAAVAPKRTATKKAAAPAPAKKTTAPRTAKKAAAPAATAAEAAPAPARKRTTATKRTAPKEIVTQRIGPGTDEFGFLLGSDSSVAAKALCEGGKDRGDINQKVEAALKKTSGLTTRSGKPKVISTIVGNVFLKLQDAGYTVESTWKVVPPQPKAKRKTA